MLLLWRLYFPLQPSWLQTIEFDLISFHCIYFFSFSYIQCSSYSVENYARAITSSPKCGIQADFTAPTVCNKFDWKVQLLIVSISPSCGHFSFEVLFHEWRLRGRKSPEVCPGCSRIHNLLSEWQIHPFLVTYNEDSFFRSFKVWYQPSTHTVE